MGCSVERLWPGRRRAYKNAEFPTVAREHGMHLKEATGLVLVLGVQTRRAAMNPDRCDSFCSVCVLNRQTRLNETSPQESPEFGGAEASSFVT